MLCKLHAGLTALLLIAAASFAGLAYTGRVRFDEPAAPACAAPECDEAGGRYRIEPSEDVRAVLEAAGKQGLFGINALEVWVFKYTGGHVQVNLETDVEGKTETGDDLPSAGLWPGLLAQDEGLRQDTASSFRKKGHIILAAMPTVIPVTDALENAGPQLGALLAAGQFGALTALPPLHLELWQKRPYRLYLSAGPITKAEGAGFAPIRAEYMMPIREPALPRKLAEEEYHVGGGKDLQAGKDVTLLDRRRGNSRIRLKARFLGDGEVREMLSRAK
jgi:hypothetical protein